VDWYAFLRLANELAESDEGLTPADKEARQRSAVSRAYYAIFLSARDIFDPEHESLTDEQRKEYHAKFWKRLRKDPDREDQRYIGQQARVLGESRRQADYGEFIYDLPHVVADAIASAEDLKERLEALPRHTA
jgi:uncharacterized protein (UPF0332 family)